MKFLLPAAALMAVFIQPASAQDVVTLALPVQPKQADLSQLDYLGAADILGVHLGDDADKAAATLKAKGYERDPRYDFRKPYSLSDTKDGVKFEFVGEIEGESAIIFKKEVDGVTEEISLAITNPYRGKFVYRVQRIIEWTDPDAAPSYKAISDQLMEKYGPSALTCWEVRGKKLWGVTANMGCDDLGFLMLTAGILPFPMSEEAQATEPVDTMTMTLDSYKIDTEAAWEHSLQSRLDAAMRAYIDAHPEVLPRQGKLPDL